MARHHTGVLVQDQNVTPMETRQLTKKLINHYATLANKVKGLDQGLSEILELLKHPNPIMETLAKVAEEYPEGSRR